MSLDAYEPGKIKTRSYKLGLDDLAESKAEESAPVLTETEGIEAPLDVEALLIAYGARANPMCEMSEFSKFRVSGMDIDNAQAAATDSCIAGGKVLLSDKAHALGYQKKPWKTKNP